jgi:hypothetical protein
MYIENTMLFEEAAIPYGVFPMTRGSLSHDI